jgi:L-2-hydroxyglutarate oxidase
VRDLEPHVQALAGIRVPATGICDYGLVARRYAELVQEAGGEILLGAQVEGLAEGLAGVVLETAAGDVRARLVVNCAGLQSDRVARLSGIDPGCRIVPFRGEYYELRKERCELVRGLVYPVPDPELPFLGVHVTRSIDGSVHVGPNAVLALHREGYRKTDISVRDTLASLAYPGFWRLAARHADDGVREIARSLSKQIFVRGVRRLLPELSADDLVPADAGIRAQALARDGSLVEDFLIVQGARSLHVCNAPSPGATCSLEIGAAIAERLVGRLSQAGGGRRASVSSSS